MTQVGPTGGDPVAAQYEKWVYPKPIEDLEAWSRSFRDVGDPQIMPYAYWPRHGYREGLNLLIAGCGANEAATFAYRNPKASVTGIDVSTSSLAHARYLKDRHGLSNLTLHRLPIEEAASLDASFDLIVATGVLHHLEDPARGLEVLGGLLKLEGVIELMVYARYGRVGVYMMQDLFRNLDLGQSEADVDLVKTALASLPANHYARSYVKASADLDFDGGLVDTFLHRRDRAYSVRDCLDLLDAAGLTFQGWLNNGVYHPDGQIHPQNPLFKRILDLPGSKKWEAMELFCGTVFRHILFACRPDRPEASYRLDFDGDALWDYIPVRWIERLTRDPSRKGPTIQRPPMPPLPLDDVQTALFDRIDGRATVREVMQTARIDADAETLAIYVRNFIKSLWRLGYLQMRIA